ncbi:hypothetical protein PUN28_015569 [Cardiocondyla obscurior]|uniref:Uncharacterized protein n=1 Tax=Cardiocondyla obscurior TaxID=286306 RepID=A0AAW2EZ06_9HYME
MMSRQAQNGGREKENGQSDVRERYSRRSRLTLKRIFPFALVRRVPVRAGELRLLVGKRRSIQGTATRSRNVGPSEETSAAAQRSIRGRGV